MSDDILPDKWWDEIQRKADASADTPHCKWGCTDSKGGCMGFCGEELEGAKP